MWEALRIRRVRDLVKEHLGSPKDPVLIVTDQAVNTRRDHDNKAYSAIDLRYALNVSQFQGKEDFLERNPLRRLKEAMHMIGHIVSDHLMPKNMIEGINAWRVVGRELRRCLRSPQSR